MSEWKKVLLKDISSYSKDRVKLNQINLSNYISTENMKPNREGVSTATSLPTAKTVSGYSPDDILISNIRPYFKKIWFADKEGGCSNDVLVIRNKQQDQVDSKYLYYSLFTDHFFDYVMTGAKGAKMPRGDKEEIMKYPLSLPPVSLQKKIVSILTSLDKKISLNHKINNTLESIVMNLYKSWFVDFIPFKDNAFKTTDLGEIPVDWEVGRLGDLVSVQNGYAFKSSQWEKEGTPVIRIKNIDPPIISQNEVAYVENNLKENLSRFILNQGDLLIGMTGAEIGKCGVFYRNNEAFLNQRVGRIKSNVKDINTIPLVYIFTGLPDFKQKVLDRATGSAQPNISSASIEDIPIILPPKWILNDFINKIKNHYKILILNHNQNYNLELTRNYLLPQLILGEIEVSEAIKKVREVITNEQPEPSVRI
ncbi:restriction endonuclease subunit S [Cytobacillus firmus]|uniref:restriction endonuclease subunit S n=1 Tax=Cytobacillus firmus TaxID=1399 RepID=UPI001C987ECB|nr:restriction endonuclease subunit S [Cytobacillus firmus]MBY6054780.1 restriction endonuclease subunit S [Cytobacillus firmus]